MLAKNLNRTASCTAACVCLARLHWRLASEQTGNRSHRSDRLSPVGTRECRLAGLTRDPVNHRDAIPPVRPQIWHPRPAPGSCGRSCPVAEQIAGRYACPSEVSSCSSASTQSVCSGNSQPAWRSVRRCQDRLHTRGASRMSVAPAASSASQVVLEMFLKRHVPHRHCNIAGLHTCLTA